MRNSRSDQSLQYTPIRESSFALIGGSGEKSYQNDTLPIGIDSNSEAPAAAKLAAYDRWVQKKCDAGASSPQPYECKCGPGS